MKLRFSDWNSGSLYGFCRLAFNQAVLYLRKSKHCASDWAALRTGSMDAADSDAERQRMQPERYVVGVGQITSQQ